MNTLPADIIALLAPFARVFSRRVFEHVKVLVCGAALATGDRTVASALRATGLTWCKRFENYHRVLNRDKWSGRLASYVLLMTLIRAFAPSGIIYLGIDETIERRKGPKIRAKGLYRDAVRSSKQNLVKITGLRWISMMLLVRVPFFGIDAYVYLADVDEYVCPEGKRLTNQGTSASGERRYATARGNCTECEMRPYCFQGKKMSNRRQLTLCVGRELIEEAKKRNLSNRYRRLRVKRSIVCEGSFGTMKSHGGLGKARWLGEEAMAIQALMCGMVHNIKKLMKFLERMREAEKAAQMSPVGAFPAFWNIVMSLPSHLRIVRRLIWQILPQSA